LLVDLALDSPPGLPASISVLGPTFDPDELAARKLLALFDRAMPRDFVDVYAVTRTRSPHDVLALARELDPGLDTVVLLVAMRRLNAYRDEDVPIDAGHAAAMREFLEGVAAVTRGRDQARLGSSANSYEARSCWISVSNAAMCPDSDGAELAPGRRLRTARSCSSAWTMLRTCGFMTCSPSPKSVHHVAMCT